MIEDGAAVNKRVETPAWIRLGGRFLKYNLVGALGLTLRLSVAILLHELIGLGYLLATSVAVEITMLHNFLWHLHWTWSDRCAGNTWSEIALRLFRFQFSNGAIALTVNFFVMRILVGEIGMGYLPANLIAIAVTGIINFLVANFLVFQITGRTASHSRSN